MPVLFSLFAFLPFDSDGEIDFHGKLEKGFVRGRGVSIQEEVMFEFQI
jgi:hypothetical protein